MSLFDQETGVHSPSIEKMISTGSTRSKASQPSCLPAGQRTSGKQTPKRRIWKQGESYGICYGLEIPGYKCSFHASFDTKSVD